MNIIKFPRKRGSERGDPWWLALSVKGGDTYEKGNYKSTDRVGSAGNRNFRYCDEKHCNRTYKKITARESKSPSGLKLL